MAIGTPVAVGTTAIGGATATPTVTTTGVVPTPARLFLIIGNGLVAGFNLSSVSGGGLTWAVDRTGTFAVDSNWGFAIASAHCPSGLASGTVITATLAGVPQDSMLALVYCTGLADTLPADVQDGQAQATNLNWDTTATSTTVADTLVLGGCIHDGFGSATNTATGGASELQDFLNASEGWAFCTEYKILSAAGSASLTGTWSADAFDSVSGFVAYKAAVTTVADTQTRRYQIRRSRMTSW